MRPSAFPPLSSEAAAQLLETLEGFEPDYLLVLPYADERARARRLAVLSFAAEILTIPARVSNPMLAAIRLKWWEEALEEVKAGGPVRQHPIPLALQVVDASPTMLAALKRSLAAMEPFLQPADDHDIEGAVSARTPFYTAVADALANGAANPLGAEAMILHALARVGGDPDCGPGEEGLETPARRFARALGRAPSLEASLAARIAELKARWRQRTNMDQQVAAEALLSALPLRLFQGRRGKIIRQNNPLWQRAMILTGMLRGRI